MDRETLGRTWDEGGPGPSLTGELDELAETPRNTWVVEDELMGQRTGSMSYRMKLEMTTPNSCQVGNWVVRIREVRLPEQRRGLVHLW